MNYVKILLSLLICISISCKPEKDGNGNTKLSPDAINNPITAADKKAKEKLPEFEFNETSHSFGQIMAGQSVTHEFEFTNTGNADLIISNASASCGCTVPEFSKEPIAPNENGKIKVVFNSTGRSGMQAKTVTVIANTIPNTKVLTISADVIAN
ncbi:MAG: DUF1573 domain-containing protein [Bacteroidia bacterium]|nr:DUF1573 domain-containing protein [Bacteroidia bacterium]NNC86164.1 DUF1573 domain-containing protein [Bacteroidia bacterium]NNM15270.1 DUF1573 domain-containing protein [Bacteroidia bacterium]